MTEDPDHKLIIITAPSGSGKTTIVNAVLKEIPQLAFSVSACTRSPRNGEQDGVNYHFLSLEEFTKKIARHEFAEFEMVYEGKYYGTLKSELKKIWDRNQIPLVDIDVYGAMRLKKHYGQNTLSLFIQAPDIQTLEARLRGRGTESEQSIRERVQKASEELSVANEFDHRIINDNLQHAIETTKNIITEFLID